MIYRATIYTPSNKALHIAADTTEQDCKVDLNTVAYEVTRMQVGMFRLHDVKRTTRKAIAGWDNVKNCTANGKTWAWIDYN